MCYRVAPRTARLTTQPTKNKVGRNNHRAKPPSEGVPLLWRPNHRTYTYKLKQIGRAA